VTALAEDTATRLLVDVGTRLPHTECVAKQAADAAVNVDPHWARAIVVAAWLHDIGYNPELVKTGLHALDGAKWTREQGFDDDVCCLVAWHTGAIFEARVRGLADQLQREFPEPPTTALDVLTWADLTSSPNGHVVSAEDRLEEILNRYEPGGEVHRAVTSATPYFRDLLRRIEQLQKASCG
jgi:hypothetical protein